MKKCILLISGLLIVGFTSCKKGNAEDMLPECDTTNVTYSGTIRPILDTKCMSCHFAGNTTGVNLSTYNGVAAVANNGHLVSAITHDGSVEPMPKDQPKLDDCTIAKITKWVNDGAPNN